MLLVNIAAAWRNREGLRYWRLLPLRSRVLLFLTAFVLVGGLTLLAVGVVQTVVHASDPPSYRCQNYDVSTQPEHGCQKDGTTLNP
jgi:hypothetical protein